MCKVEAGETAVTIWLSRECMPSGEREVARLVHRILAERGLEPWPAVAAECFSAGEEMLILARPGIPRPRGYLFPDLESVLEAAFACGGGESELYRAEGGYLLVVPEPALPALCEYAQEWPLHPDWTAHAREQGLCLLEKDAIGQLVRIFSTACL